jgi:hypothetical protein
MMLNDTFSKLSTVIADSKSSETKSDYPKFIGDSKKFFAWYLAIMAQLSLSPWQELYDSTLMILCLLLPIHHKWKIICYIIGIS